MSGITTHILDVVLGKPASGVTVHLEKRKGDEWVAIATSWTDADGRCRDLVADAAAGSYRLTFGTGAYFHSQNRVSIYPEISVAFDCDGNTHYHIPLLLSENSYTTYRGS